MRNLTSTPTYLDVVEDLRALRPAELGGDDDGDVAVAASREVEPHAGEVAARLAQRAAGEAADDQEGHGGGRRQLESLHCCGREIQILHGSRSRSEVCLIHTCHLHFLSLCLTDF